MARSFAGSKRLKGAPASDDAKSDTAQDSGASGKSGGSGKTVKSREQAIAIGLSEARESGAKVPRKKGGTRKKKARKKK